MLQEGYWIAVLDGDLRALALYRRHYSALTYAAIGGRRNTLFCGPGQKTVLLTEACDALFVWRKFIDKSGQQGVNCAVFRNEGSVRSSLLIAEAEQWAWRRWPGARLYTYVNARKVRSSNPGCCFQKSGWVHCGASAARKLLIFEKIASSNR